MIKLKILSTIVILTSLMSSSGFAENSEVEYSERYSVLIAELREQPMFDNSNARIPVSEEDERNLICASKGQIYLSTNLGGLTVNLADDAGRMDFVLYISGSYQSHLESVNSICDKIFEIKNFTPSNEITLCTPKRYAICN